MFSNDYSKMVNGLAKSGELILDEMTPEGAHLLHMSSCIMGELGEFLIAPSRENAVEELGDILFYVCGIVSSDTLKGISPPEIEPRLVEQRELFALAADVFDLCKKHAFYLKPISRVDLFKALSKFLGALKAVADYNEISFSEAIAANFEKLGKRYPNAVFSNADAQARADKSSGDDGEEETHS